MSPLSCFPFSCYSCPKVPFSCRGPADAVPCPKGDEPTTVTNLDMNDQGKGHAAMNADKLTRRKFLSTSAVAAGLLVARSDPGQAAQPKAVTKAALDRILARPVL